MKLYATVTSERATKGQGGNKRLEVTIQGGEFRDILARFEVLPGDEFTRPFYCKIIDGDRDFLVNLKSNISFFLDQTEKGEKQKGEYTYLTSCIDCKQRLEGTKKRPLDNVQCRACGKVQ